MYEWNTKMQNWLKRLDSRRDLESPKHMVSPPSECPYVCRKVTDITSGVRENKSWLIFIDMQIAFLKACLSNLVNKITSPAFLLVRSGGDSDMTNFESLSSPFINL